MALYKLKIYREALNHGHNPVASKVVANNVQNEDLPDVGEPDVDDRRVRPKVGRSSFDDKRKAGLALKKYTQ
jgi:hypothetical protein